MSTTPSDLLTRLSATLSRLDRAVAAGRSGRWNHKPADGWSAHEILAHLRASNDILTPRIVQILVRDNPPLIAFDERKWSEINGFESQSVDVLFERIASQRQDLVHALRRVPESDWSRAGTHEVHGPLTVAQIAAHLIGHEEEHLDEIERLIAHDPA
jgi:hypothetical protein